MHFGIFRRSPLLSRLSRFAPLRLLAGTALTLLCACLLPAAPAAGAGEPGAVVKVGVAFSATGDFATLGNIYRAGVEIRLAQFNREEAKTYGFRIEPVFRDNRSDSTRAAVMARELIEKERVVAIIGAASTDMTIAMLPVAREHGVPVVSPSATSPEIGRPGDISFRVLFDDRFQGASLARFARGKLGLRRAAVIRNRRFIYSQFLADAFAEAFAADGGIIVADESYQRRLDGGDRFDFRPVLTRLSDAKPEIVLIASYADDASAILRSSLQLGFEPIFCGGDAWQKDSILYESGNSLDGAYFVGSLDDRSGTPEMTEFMGLLNQSHDLSAELTSALGYDAMSLVIEAMRKGRTPEKILTGLRSIKNFPLVSGPISIDAKFGVRKTAYIFKVVKKGNGFVQEVAERLKP